MSFLETCVELAQRGTEREGTHDSMRAHFPWWPNDFSHSSTSWDPCLVWLLLFISVIVFFSITTPIVSCLGKSFYLFPTYSFTCVVCECVCGMCACDMCVYVYMYLRWLEGDTGYSATPFFTLFSWDRDCY